MSDNEKSDFLNKEYKLPPLSDEDVDRLAEFVLIVKEMKERQDMKEKILNGKNKRNKK